MSASVVHAGDSWAVRSYAVLLRMLLPRSFQRAFGSEMLEVFRDLEGDAARRHGMLGRARALLAELPGVAELAVRERRALRPYRHVPSYRQEPMRRSTTDTLWQDTRYALRTLRRAPMFTAVAILSLALGVGATTAIFSVVNGVLLAPLPLREPDRLVALGEGTESDAADVFNSTTAGSFLDWQSQLRSMRIAAYSSVYGVVTGHGDAERLSGANSLGGVLDLAGVPPLLGRTLSIADENPASPYVIVLSYPLWQRLYGGDRRAIGTSLTVNDIPRVIVGVMPESFRFPDGTTEFWVPSRLAPAARANRDQYFLQVVGRLAPSVTLEGARAEAQVLSERMRRDWPAYNSNLVVRVQPLRERIVGDIGPRLLMLMGTVTFVLLITCANLGNLLLARAHGRRREMAIRQAMGAARRRIAQQLLTESLLLALAGGVAALLVAKALLAVLLTGSVGVYLPRIDEIALDRRVLVFTLGVSVLAGLAFGIAPAWQLARARWSDALRHGARGAGAGGRVRAALVVSELALAMMLLTGAGLLLRSFARLQSVDPGFPDRDALVFDVSVNTTPRPYFDAALERLSAIAGVRSVELTSQLPVTGRGGGAWFNRLDRPLPPDVKPDGEPYRVVSPRYLESLGLRLLRGRFPDGSEGPARAAVVINAALARKYYPGEDPVGRPIYLGAPDNRLFPRGEIIGVVGDTRDAGLDTPALPTVFIPRGIMPEWRSFSFVVFTNGDPMRVAAAARAALRSLNGAIPIRNIRTLAETVGESVAPARWSTMLVGLFAAIAVIMAALGVFGVLSFLVTQQTKEIAIRLALGAQGGSVRRMILGRAFVMTALGLVPGVLGAVVLSRMISNLLFGIERTDPASYVVAAGGLMLVALLASYLPARRATRIDPMKALQAS